MIVQPELFGMGSGVQWGGRAQGSTAIPRDRRHVSSIFAELGANYLQRAYRMDKASFYDLHRMLRPGLGGRKYSLKSSKKFHKNGAPNGLIPSTSWLSMALRYFAGGSAYDICIAHGCSHSDVYNSVWMVVDAVNLCKKLKIKYPTSYGQQRKIARGFVRKSDAGFDNCVGAIDGILIWVDKPSDADCKDVKVGPKKFFCGRKKKFGLNMQAICDSHG